MNVPEFSCLCGQEHPEDSPFVTGCVEGGLHCLEAPCMPCDAEEALEYRMEIQLDIYQGACP